MKLAIHKSKGLYSERWIAYCEEKLRKEAFDYFLFGHRHFPMKVHLNKGSFYFNTGDWLNYDSYAVMEKGVITLNSLRDDVTFPEIL